MMQSSVPELKQALLLTKKMTAAQRRGDHKAVADLHPNDAVWAWGSAAEHFIEQCIKEKENLELFDGASITSALYH